MEVIIRAWGLFIDTITRGGKKVLTDPFLYLVIGLLLIIFFALYDVTGGRRRKRYSVLGVIDHAVKLVLGFIGDSLAALESITNFIDVIRIVLMGKLTEATQFLLNNYAIVALSVASFTTTMNGMVKSMGNSAGGWAVAAMITFGVQVAILAMSYKISFEWGKREKSKKRLQQEVSYHDEKIKMMEEFKKKNEREKEFQDKDITGLQPDEKGISKRAIAQYGVLLALSMMVSVGFSYQFFFEKWVMPSVPIENYISVVNLVKDQAESYSQSILEYQSVLVGELQKFNDDMRAYIEVPMEEVRKLNASASRIREELEEQQEKLESLRTERESLEIQIVGETDEGELDRIEVQRTNLSTQIIAIEDKIEDLEEELDDVYAEQEGSAVYLRTDAAYQALDLLDMFYADALYLTNSENVEQMRADVRGAFSTLIQYTAAAETQEGEAESVPGTGADGSISIIFNNYMNLCTYYEEGLTDAEEKNAAYSIGLNKAEMDSILNVLPMKVFMKTML